MKHRDMEVVLGIVVLAAMVSLIVGVGWISSRLNLRVGDYKLHIIFDDLGTLHAGDHINVKGIQVGKVLKTELYQGKPAIYAAIWGVRGGVPKDSEFLLKSESLLGGYIVDIEMGSSPETIEPESFVIGTMAVGLESLAPEAKRLSERLSDPKAGVLSDANMRRIESILTSLDSSMALVTLALSENRRPVRALLDTLGGTVSELRGLLGENRPDLQRTLRHLSATTGRLDSLTANLGAASGSLRDASENLREITGRLRRGQGTLGKLLQDEQLYGDMRRTLSHVDSILVDVQRDPRRYIHISIF